jgi:ribosomal subunit interface protein
MDIAVRGRHLEVPEDVRQRAESKLGGLERYLHGMERCEVLFSDGKKGHLGDPVSCELRLVAEGRVVRAAAVGPKPDAALESAFEKAVHRLTKINKKLVARSRPRHKTPKPAALPLALGQEEVEGS